MAAIPACRCPSRSFCVQLLKLLPAAFMLSAFLTSLSSSCCVFLTASIDLSAAFFASFAFSSASCSASWMRFFAYFLSSYSSTNFLLSSAAYRSHSCSASCSALIRLVSSSLAVASAFSAFSMSSADFSLNVRSFSSASVTARGVS